MKKIGLIEVLIGLVLVALVVAVRLPNFILWHVRAKEAAFAVNYSAVQKAAEDFAIQKNGLYPWNIDEDETPSGQTLLDIVAIYDTCPNPYTGKATKVVNGKAWIIGQIGYVPALEDGIPVGDTITAVGITGTKVIECH